MDRQKNLDTAISQIERQFGKGAIMRLGEESLQNVATISTGALSLDLALGVGGVPRGRVVEIFGPEASGKCLTADTLVWTDHGLETVEELFARCGQAASCTSRITDVEELGLRVVNERGELEPVRALTHNNRRRVLEVSLRSGRSIKVTENHPLRVMTTEGSIVWRRAGELAPGDVVVSALFGAEEAALGDGLTEDEAVLLGYLVAEGTLCRSNAVVFTNRDPEVGGEFDRLMERLFGMKPKLYNDQEHVVHSKAVRVELAERYGLDYVRAAGKEVPHCVRVGGEKVQRAFLSALFEGDGWIDGSSTIGFASASEQLATQVQLLLYGFGIPASLSSSWNARLERNYWTVTVNPAVAHRFLEEIGFRSQRRSEQVERCFRRSAHEPRLENVPHISGLIRNLRDSVGGDREFDRIARDLFRTDFSLSCSRERLRRVVAWAEARQEGLSASGRHALAFLKDLVEARYTYEEVVAVEDGGYEPTFDLMVPGTQSFVANGILSHNTTLALHVVAEAQRNGGIAAFVDAEHALDPIYARALGVNVDELLVSQPDTGEQALEIAEMLIRSGAVDVLVIDSVAALVPRAEIEGEMGDQHVGLQARLMSQALRKLAGTINRSRTTAIFINQLREKVGVMFGCLSYQTRVTLADGSQEKIGKIVNQRLPVEVLSYDAERDEIVPRRVVNWFDNGRTDEFLRFTVARGAGNGRSQFACTPNHLIRTPEGWREAEELEVGDHVLQAVPYRLSEFQWEVLLGGLMGDSALSPTRSGYGARLRWGHGEKQVEYGDWKASLFSNLGISRSTNEKGAVFWDMQPLPELAELRQAVYVGDKKVLSWDYLKRLTPLSLAIWYVDDATFSVRSKGLQERTRGGSGRAEICVEALEPGSRERLVAYLADTWGIRSKLIDRAGKAVLQFPTAETAKLQALIAPYIHPSMDYKLLPRFHGRFSVEPVFQSMRYELVPMPVLKIERKPPNGRHTHRFDIEVEGSHNYFADGVMVHNSPETTPGGRALKFYSSVRIDVRRIESIKDGSEHIGNRVRARVVKNKCVAVGTRVFDPSTGFTHPIEEIVEEDRGISVWAIDKAGKLHVRPILNRWYQGEREVIGLRMRDGTTLQVTPDHKVFTDRGWRQAGDLRVGDSLARPRRGERPEEIYLPERDIEPVLEYLRARGVTARMAAGMIGDLAPTGEKLSLRAVLGASRLRRDRLERLADALDSEFLCSVLDEDVWYDRIVEITEPQIVPTYDIEVEELRSFVADDVVVHNCAPPFRTAEFDIMFGKGISWEGSLLDVAVETGAVRKSGAWYTFDDDQLGQGRENSKEFLRENPEVAMQLQAKVLEAVGLGARLRSSEEEEEQEAEAVEEE